MRLCHASRWKMAALITNHVIMWKPQHPQRITESLLDKMNDSLWTAYWWWLSMREMGGQICMWVCIYLEDLSEFWDYAEVSNWIWKMRWKCRITLDYYFTFNICNSWRNNGKWHQAERNSKSALQYLNPLFNRIKCNNLGNVTHLSCQGEWYSHQAFWRAAVTFALRL